MTSASEAAELLEDIDFDAVVSDYKMPEMNGLEFLEIVREKKKSDIPFIIFTGKGRDEIAIDALRLGADRYLKKGGDPKTQYKILANAISQEVKYHQLEQELTGRVNS